MYLAQQNQWNIPMRPIFQALTGTQTKYPFGYNPGCTVHHLAHAAQPRGHTAIGQVFKF